ncbi:MAG TPA: 3-methyl-2-oxobutanoate hydroxymethyltransferase [Egibacteraceae bacterium]|nr:3-methyl-2-oxobutanoate hydroxymethyltransferase [Egibacteraceae bacterium]
MSVHSSPGKPSGSHGAPQPLSIHDLKSFKQRGERFTMLTAYDFLTAQILDEAGVPVLLVGDSLGMVMLGYDSTVPVTMDEMLHHTRAVRRGASRALVVGDMPFMSYQGSTDEAIRNAGRFLKEGGANAVKLEGGGPVLDLVARLVSIGIPVMGHLGLTPQSVNQFGGFKVQGRAADDAERILDDAIALADAGAFSIVLECVPAELAARVTEAVPVPTIGIGAGAATDGQVLVIQDLLGLTAGRLPRFVKQYANLRGQIADAAKGFQHEVASGDYPGPEHAY